MRAKLAVLLSIALALSYCQFASAKATTWSNASAWAYEELMMADSCGLIPFSLYSEDFIRPVSRAEFAAVTVRLHEEYTGSFFLPDSQSVFSDIGEDDVDILIAYNLGIVQGVGGSRFDPDGGLTREQMATMLWRTLKLLVPDVENSIWSVPTYSDEGMISNWALESVLNMGGLGFVRGMGNGAFEPVGAATCEQAIIISYRIFAKYKELPN